MGYEEQEQMEGRYASCIEHVCTIWEGVMNRNERLHYAACLTLMRSCKYLPLSIPDLQEAWPMRRLEGRVALLCYSTLNVYQMAQCGPRPE